jgi:hypothetical protein
MSPRLTVIEKEDVKNFRSPSRPLRARSMHGQVQRLEVQPIRHHQLDPCLAARRNHPAAFIDGHRHRLLAQHVDAGTRRTNRVFGMHGVRQGDVDGVDDAQALVELLVRECVVQSVSPSQFAAFRAVAADNAVSCELRLA